MIAESDIRRVIVFNILDYCWALPIESVLRVVNFSLGANRELISMGVIQIGRHMIRALDLHRHLSSGRLSQAPGDSPFLVIIRSAEGELCGIPVDAPPDLMEVSPEMIRSLPPSIPQIGLLKMVSGVVVGPEEASSKTIFLLDIHRALSASLPEALALPSNQVGSGVE